MKKKKIVEIDSPLLTAQQAATYISMASGTLSNMRGRGDGPKYIKLGNRIRYRKIDLENYLEVNTKGQSAYAKKVG